MLPHLMIKVNRKQLNSDRMINGTDPSAMKVWVAPPGKEPRSVDVLAKGGGNAEWIIEEGR